MELRSSSQEGIHRDRGGFNNNLSTHSLPKEGSSSKLSAAAAASNILATTVTDRRRSHGGSSSTSTVLNQHPPQQTLDPHLPHPHLLLPDPHYSNNLPHPQTNSNPDPQDLIAPPPPPPPPPSNDEPIIISSTSTTTASASASVQYIYGECLKNHAASMGGHVVDGCGEFMPRGEENTPEALRCAACDCHRNFHRREVQGQGQGEENNNINSIITPQIPSAGNNNNHTSQRITNSHHHLLLQHQQHHNAGRYGAHGGPIPLPPVMMAFRGGGAAEYSSSEDLNVYYDSNNNNNNNNDGGTTTQARGKKRYRTKFSQGQKERMQEFAERVLGWKMQKQDDEQVEKFCEEVGVKRQVFKVWMHNNKAAAINKNKPH